AVGRAALGSTTSGDDNSASGFEAMYSNTTGAENAAFGHSALRSNTAGGFSCAFGKNALYNNTIGTENTAIGFNSLYNNKTGANNTALGDGAGYGGTDINFTQCSFIGANSNLSTARSNVTMLGYGILNGQCTADNQVLLGNTAVTQIRAQVSSITTYSDGRFKTNVKENVAGLDFILKLKPVTYNQKPSELHKIWGTPADQLRDIDHSEIERQRFIGFIAQDVESAARESGFDFPGIDVPAASNEAYALRYADFIMPLVKAVQEQQTIIENQQAAIDQLLKRVELLEQKVE
ncbi:MAG TPA: tail fiber domain-containing protein, partial [Bacteroidales bacterium]|nr:tail fiber domain-containing protein [Bacteroidales bacterium]